MKQGAHVVGYLSKTESFYLSDHLQVKDTNNTLQTNMEYIFPTVQHAVQLLPMDPRITPPPDQKNAVYSTIFGAPPSESSEAMSEATQSSDGSTPSGPSGKGRNERRSSGPTRGRQADTTQHHSSSASLVFSPRPYKTMYAERAYLTSSLQLQTSRSADLIRKYSFAEARHQHLEAGKERRRLRKHLRFLRSKMIEAAEQQKTVYSRLGELHVEIQSREAWILSGYQGSSFMDITIPESPSVYSTMSSYDLSTPTTPLDATSPAFVPQGYFGDDVMYPLDPLPCQKEPKGASRSLDTVVEESDELLPKPELNDISSECGNGEVDVEMNDTDSESAWLDDCFKVTRSRRLSLPYIQTAWPET